MHLQPRAIGTQSVSAKPSHTSAGEPESSTATHSCWSGSGQSAELSQTRLAGHPDAPMAIKIEKESRHQNAMADHPTRLRPSRYREPAARGDGRVSPPHRSRAIAEPGGERRRPGWPRPESGDGDRRGRSLRPISLIEARAIAEPGGERRRPGWPRPESGDGDRRGRSLRPISLSTARQTGRSPTKRRACRRTG
jgi:hypothetical protein